MTDVGVGKRKSLGGRPRDERIDAAVLAATVVLLEEIGYTRLTIPLVAARAGATPPAVYRRFPTKVALVYEAVFPAPVDEELPWTDEAIWAEDIETSVRTLVAMTADLLSRPAVWAAVSGLIAELASQPGLSSELLGRLQGNTYENLQQHLDAAAAAGKVTPGTDARLLVDTVGGLVMMALANERKLDGDWVDGATRLIWGGLGV